MLGPTGNEEWGVSLLVCAGPDIWTPILYFQVKGTRVTEGSVELTQQPPTDGRQVSAGPHCGQLPVQWASGPGTVPSGRLLGSFLGDPWEGYSSYPQERGLGKREPLPHEDHGRHFPGEV